MGRRNKSKSWDTRSVGLLASVMLGGALLALLFPTAGKGALATDCTSDSSPDSPECTMRTGVNTNLTTTVRSSIAVALSAAVELDVTPKARGAFSTSKAEMQITTNNTTGYAVYLQTADNTSELKAANPQVSEAIMPVEGSMTETNYDNNLNTWGYAIGAPEAATQYKAVPKSGDEAILKTEGVSREDSYDVAFAVAVGADLPAGVYTNELLVSVVANPIEVRSLNDLNYMQDMMAEICNITFEGEAKQLIDIRDGKSYKVAKLKDGNCWMVENLKITFGEGEGMVNKLTANDSDLTTGKEWTPEVTEVTTHAAITSNNVLNGIASWNIIDLADGAQWYYQFNAATAGTGQDVMAEQAATDSICPKGWKLPLSGSMNDGKNGSFQKLLAAYNVPNDSGDILLREPLNFTKAGFITEGETIGYLSAAGLYWSSVVAEVNRYPYLLDFNAKLANPSGVGYKNLLGLAVRCVVRE